MNKLLSFILIALLFFGLSKFVTWYPTFNSILFYFLAFWFAWSIRLIPSRIKAVGTAIRLNKSIGFSSYFIVEVFLLLACWTYLIYTIVSNIGLYQSWALIGLIAFLLFVVLSTLTLIASMLISPK